MPDKSPKPTTVAIEVREATIELRPVEGAGQLKRVNGVLVFAGAAPLEAGGDLAAESREERIGALTKGIK